MPNYFNLIKKGQAKSSSLQEVDTELWVKFTGKPDAKDNNQWYASWHGTIGLALAMGREWETIISNLKKDNRQELCVVAEYLQENYDVSSGYLPN